jgi:hypothetical protein
MERRPTTRPGSEPLLVPVPPCFATSLFIFCYPSHPGARISPILMKTIAEKFSSRHTPARLRRKSQGDENSKGEEKALAAVACRAKVANRNTRPFKNP